VIHGRGDEPAAGMDGKIHEPHRLRFQMADKGAVFAAIADAAQEQVAAGGAAGSADGDAGGETAIVARETHVRPGIRGREGRQALTAASVPEPEVAGPRVALAESRAGVVKDELGAAARATEMPQQPARPRLEEANRTVLCRRRKAAAVGMPGRA